MDTDDIETKVAEPPCQAHAEGKEASSAEERASRAPAVIFLYLRERVPEFQRLTELRRLGWENPEGDKFFQQQRQKADNSDGRSRAFFYGLMKNIGQEIHQVNSAFKIQTAPTGNQQEILDMCMAPGGFLATALDVNPGARALGFSLPMSEGGHRVLLKGRERQKVRLVYLDVTMLAADMGVSDIPSEHEDAANFLPRQFEQNQLFDMVLCDGQVLRTQSLASYREPREARRLTNAQLALGLEHMRPGGTMIVLLHKAEAWETVLLLRAFDRFASIRLHKPRRAHAKRSSFYLIASNVKSRDPEAILAIEKWKEMWRIATFVSDKEEYWESIYASQPDTSEVLQDFGSKLISLGREVWDTQANALERMSFCRKMGSPGEQS